MQELVFLIGLPAAGKSTVANRYRELGYVILSSDKMREHLYGDVNTQDFNGELFTKLYKIARKMLSINKNVVIDATNITMKNRKNAINSILTNTKKDEIQLDLNNINVIAQIVLCPYNECIDRNKSRDRQVPSHVIEKMYKSWETPVHGEGFKSIMLDYTTENTSDLRGFFEYLKNNLIISQYNKNHTKTILGHSMEVGNYLSENYLDNNILDEELVIAGYMHDIGKKFCMSFKDSNNKLSNDAHFYNHENVGSYDSFFFRLDSVNLSNLRVAQLINYHMLPHLLHTEKAINKRIELFGIDFWNDLLLLNEADNKGR